MLENILVAGAAGVLELPLVGGDLDVTPLSAQPFQIRNITGLGPVAAAINTTPFGSIDGESYSGSSIPKRNIVITIGLNPDWVSQSVAYLRQYLYAFFMPKQPLNMIFQTDNLPDCTIHGYVESCEPNIFAKDSEVQVSFVCPMPDFIATDETIQIGTVGLGLFDDDPVGYDGTVDTGFTLLVEPTVANAAYTGNITVRVSGYPGLTAVGVTVDNLNSFKMSSERGNKYLRNDPSSGPDENILQSLQPGSVWPILKGAGTNYLSVFGTEAGQEWTLTYKARFGGL